MSGRPSTFSKKVGDAICDLLTEGKSLNTICKDAKMPSASTVYVWLDRFPEFAEQYARAREAATEKFLEDIFEIADNGKLDPKDKRIRIDARKWAMGKLKPKKYGDRQQLDLGNKDGEALKVEHGAATPEQLAELARFFLTQQRDA